MKRVRGDVAGIPADSGAAGLVRVLSSGIMRMRVNKLICRRRAELDSSGDSLCEELHQIQLWFDAYHRGD